MNKKVIITGILGQDGSTMAEYLLRNTDHHVYGMYRRSATPNHRNIEMIPAELRSPDRFELCGGDLTDEVSINNLVQHIQPDYFINFGANSFVGCSWDMPVQVFDVNSAGVLRCLEAIRKYQPKCRFYSAGSSEEFGDVVFSPQDINHPIRPRSPYGASKASARHLVKVYRDSYHLYAVHGILFNHEGTRRSEEFVTRKITKGVARIKNAIKNGKSFEPIELGNLDAKRDWSDAEDFVDGVWRMLNQDKDFWSPLMMPFQNSDAKEYVLASGESHSIREFVEEAFRVAEVPIQHIISRIEPKHLTERYCLSGNDNAVVVRVNEKFYRPAEVNILCGDSSEARAKLGWSPAVSFKQLVAKMVVEDLSLV